MGSCERDSQGVKFGIDAMLGKLVKIMRFYGFDTVYFKDEKDIKIVAKCLKEGRILITSDSELHSLAKGWGLKVIFLENRSKDFWEVGRKILKMLDLKPNPFTRCPKCNGILRRISKWEVEGFVHPFVWNKFDEFSVCDACGQIYWEGTHYYKIKNNLKISDYEDE